MNQTHCYWMIPRTRLYAIQLVDQLFPLIFFFLMNVTGFSITITYSNNFASNCLGEHGNISVLI